MPRSVPRPLPPVPQPGTSRQKYAALPMPSPKSTSTSIVPVRSVTLNAIAPVPDAMVFAPVPLRSRVGPILTRHAATAIEGASSSAALPARLTTMSAPGSHGPSDPAEPNVYVPSDAATRGPPAIASHAVGGFGVAVLEGAGLGGDAAGEAVTAGDAAGGRDADGEDASGDATAQPLARPALDMTMNVTNTRYRTLCLMSRSETSGTAPSGSSRR
jgi:hypothetical protein